MYNIKVWRLILFLIIKNSCVINEGLEGGSFLYLVSQCTARKLTINKHTYCVFFRLFLNNTVYSMLSLHILISSFVYRHLTKLIEISHLLGVSTTCAHGCGHKYD